MSDLEDFTTFLFGSKSGYAYAPIKDKDLKWTEKFFHWPMESTKLHDWIRTSTIESDVYLAPVLFNSKSAKRIAVKSSDVFWVEFDGQTRINFKGLPEPNYIVQTSTETHQHCYWKINGQSPVVIEELNRRLTYHFEADSSGWEMNQVLRPPETINHKRGQNLAVKVIKNDKDTTHLLEMFDGVPSISHPVSIIEYTSLTDPNELLARLKLGSTLDARITRELPVENGRSTFLMHTGHLLAEAGCNHLEIVSLLYLIDFRIKKFVGRADQLIRLSEIASLALLKIEQDTEVDIYSPVEVYF